MSFKKLQLLIVLVFFVILLFEPISALSSTRKDVSDDEFEHRYPGRLEFCQTRLRFLSNAEKHIELAYKAKEFSNPLALYHLIGAANYLKNSEFLNEPQKFPRDEEARQMKPEFYRKFDEKYPLAQKYSNEINTAKIDIRHKASEEAKTSLAECLLYTMCFDSNSYDSPDYEKMKKVIWIYEQSGETADAMKLKADLYEFAICRLSPIKWLYQIADLALILHDSGEKEKALKLASMCFSELTKAENRDWACDDVASLVRFYSHINDLKMIEKVITANVTYIEEDDRNRAFLSISKVLASDSRFDLVLNTIQHIKDDKLKTDNYKFILSKLDLTPSHQLSFSIMDKILAESNIISLPSSRSALVCELSMKYFDAGNPEKAFSILQNAYDLTDISNLPLLNINDLGYLIPALSYINQKDLALLLVDYSYQKTMDTVKKRDFVNACLLIFASFYFQIDEVDRARDLLSSIILDEDNKRKSLTRPEGIDFTIFKKALETIVIKEKPSTITEKLPFLKYDLFDRYIKEGEPSDALKLLQYESNADDLYLKAFDSYIAEGEADQARWVLGHFKKPEYGGYPYQIIPKLAAATIAEGDYDSAEYYLLMDYQGVMNPNTITSFLTFLSKIEPSINANHKNLSELLTGLVDEYTFYQDLKQRGHYSQFENAGQELDRAYKANNDILSTALFVSHYVKYTTIKDDLSIAKAYFNTGNPDMANEIIMDIWKTELLQSKSWYNSDSFLDIAETCIEVGKLELAVEIAGEVKRQIQEKPLSYLSYGFLFEIVNIYLRCGEPEKVNIIMRDLYENENLYLNECNRGNLDKINMLLSLYAGDYETAIGGLNKIHPSDDGFDYASAFIDLLLSKNEVQWAIQLAEKNTSIRFQNKIS